MRTVTLNPLAEPAELRLSQATRDLAFRYLTGVYRSRLQDCGFSIAELDLPTGTPPETIHAKATILNAQKCRIDVLPEELLTGIAANMEGVRHFIPGYPAENPVSSISHVTADFGNAVRLGLSGLEKEIHKYQQSADRRHNVFYEALLDVIVAMRVWIKRYITALQEKMNTPDGQPYRRNLCKIIARLQNVPENPPQSFTEAVQSLWSFWEFQRLCGNWSGLGRIDEYLGPYLKNDLERGVITLDEAREYLAHFWIKGTEWCFGLRSTNLMKETGSGDAQNYQNIILSGIDAEGNHIENEVTFLVLDIVEELHISDFPVTVRLNQYTSGKLYRRIAEVQLLGGGIVSVYNEPVIIEGMKKAGFEEREVRTFTNDGCWEILIPGQTRFIYYPRDILLPLQSVLFEKESSPESFEELYQAFIAEFTVMRDSVAKDIEGWYFHEKQKPSDYPANYEHADVTLSLVMPSCRESGCSYSLDGAKYRIISPHMMGLPDVANSLYAIKKFVFEEKIISFAELREILRNDWNGHEELRKYCLNTLSCYGNDDEEADNMLKRVFNDCSAILNSIGRLGYVYTVVGVSTFGREISCAPLRMATAYGKHAHEFLAPNLSPTPGTDKSSLTAVVNSYCKMDFTNTPNGCPLDLRLSAGFRQTPDAAGILAGVLKTFFQKGGMYMQIDTVDPDMLRAAQKDPDRFPNLVVRISGWSARFASLSEEWQNMIINRTALGL